MTKIFFIAQLYLLLFLVSAVGTLQASTQTVPVDLTKDPGYQALTSAVKSNKFLMVNLYSEKPAKELEKACSDVHSILSDNLETVNIDVKNPGSKFLVEKFNLRYAPLPIVIIVAPNGVISGSFKSEFSSKQVKATFHTPKTLECLLVFQERKLLFISVQGKTTSDNKESLGSIRKFEKENPLYRVGKLVVLDPKDNNETSLLKRLRIQPDIKQAQTFLMAPPGRIIGQWAGATDPGKFVARLKSLSKSCSTPSCVDPTCK